MHNQGILAYACICSCAVTGCAATGSGFPVVDVQRAEDAALSCSALDDQLVKADVLRSAIFAETVSLRWEDATTATASLLNPITAIFAVTTAAGTVERETRFREAIVAAEARLRVLLDLKEAGSCPGPGAEVASQRTDIETLVALRDIDAELTAGRLSATAANEASRKLFDELR